MDFLLYPTQNLPDLPTHFLGLNLFRIERSVLMNRAHPLIKAYEAGQTLKAEDFRKYPRILVKLQDSSRRAIYDVTVPDPRLGEAFIELPYFLGAPYSSKAQSTRWCCRHELRNPLRNNSPISLQSLIRANTAKTLRG